MVIACTAETEKEPLEIPAPGVTLLQLIHALFWEFSFFGTPAEREAKRAALKEQVKRINSGEEELIPWEDFWKEGEGQGSTHRIRS